MSTNLVPQLWSAFNLETASQINFDPIIVASYCFVTGSPLTSTLSFENGKFWFPQRSVKNIKGEAARLRRFSEQFPSVFSYSEEDEGSISLQEAALTTDSVHELDEPTFRIALYRIGASTPEVFQVLDDLEVGSGEAALGFPFRILIHFFRTSRSSTFKYPISSVKST